MRTRRRCWSCASGSDSHSLNLNSYAEYCKYLFGGHGQKEEIVHLIDVVTTNKTDFFREPDHFEFLIAEGDAGPYGAQRERAAFLVWSAGCSTGEEPYTLAMVLNECRTDSPRFSLSGCWPPISPPPCWRRPHLGVFSQEVVRSGAAELRRKYFMRSRDPDSEVVRVVPELRRTGGVSAAELHGRRLRLVQKADVIFCRNVIIYFDRPTQEQDSAESWPPSLCPGDTPSLATPKPCTIWISRWCRWRPALYRKDRCLNSKASCTEVYLLPGELYLAREPAIIRTILGSCVGVTFWSARLGVGALCHSLLPRCPTNGSAPMARAWGHRYVDFAIRDLAR